MQPLQVCLNTSRFSMLVRGSVGHTFGVPSRLLSQAWRWACNDVPQKWQVSSEGRCCDTRGRITLGFRHPSGYHFVRIGGKLWPVHTLVKRTFDGPTPSTEADEVHHKDGNKASNRLSNLEYVTRSQNMTYFFASSVISKRQSSRMQPIMWRPVGSTDFGDKSINSAWSKATWNKPQGALQVLPAESYNWWLRVWNGSCRTTIPAWWSVEGIDWP